MNTDDTDRQSLTNSSAADSQHDRQPVPLVGYARSKSAHVVAVSLVPAYPPCAAPNRTHGPPLAFGSCDPPQSSATQLTLGTPDAERAVGPLRRARDLCSVSRAIPLLPQDEADVAIALDITDVRNANDLSDYTG